MATPDYWAEPRFDRYHAHIFYPTLDQTIRKDDPVRLVDEALAAIDWSDWEAGYRRERGQPPIHPRYVAGAILYGMFRGIRSTRRLEEACCYRVDFMWLINGHHIDHTTFNRFRTRFREPLKNLFRQIGRMAMALGLIRLGVVAFDGTRVKANNSRYKTLTAKRLEEKLRELDALFEELMSKMDAEQAEPSGEGSPTHLPPELADVEKRRQRIQEALEKARAADETRRREGVNPAKNPAQVPITDMTSRVMPHKEGGYGPNYTPVAATDAYGGFIVDAYVLAEVNESPAAAPSVDRIEETFGKKPEQFMTDSGNNSGQIMLDMEKRGVEFYAPVTSSEPKSGDPAWREDPTKPVPESEWPRLQRNGHGLLDKSCFIYDPAQDLYYCPMGHPMPFDKSKPDQRGSQQIKLRVYRCQDCTGCPLASNCVLPKNQHGRTITRDGYEEVRKRTAQRMSSEAGRQLYKQRPRIAETTFGILKHVMGFRQFLLRGLEKVKTEWLWAVTAFNVMKLIRALGTMRADRNALAIAATK